MRLLSLLLALPIAAAACSKAEEPAAAPADSGEAHSDHDGHDHGGEAQPATAPSVPGALTESDIETFIDVHTTYIQIPRILNEQGIRGQEAIAEQESRFDQVLLEHNLSPAQWSDLYKTVVETKRLIELERDPNALAAKTRANFLLVQRYKDEIDQSFQR